MQTYELLLLVKVIQIYDASVYDAIYDVILYALEHIYL